MATYTRLGSYILATELATDPFGKIHRGLSIAGGSFEKHVLVRTFGEELLSVGLGPKLAEVTNVLPRLVGARGFATNTRIERGRTPHIVSDYTPGRSLAQVLEKTQREQVPLGLDHALAVLQGIGKAILHMHSQGLSHGMLTPHSIWVSFEGAIQLLDAPFVGALQGILPKAKLTFMSLERYRKDNPIALQKDFYSLGAIFYELLTLTKLPSADLVQPTLAKATLKAAQDESPIPPEMLNLLKRLLGLDQPFTNAAAFTDELDRVLYDGNYSPTTFNMAFFMHTLFREENEQDVQAMKADQAADFSPFVDVETERRSAFEGKEGQRYGTYIFAGASVLVVFLGALIWSNIASRREARKLRAELYEVERVYLMEQQHTADLKKEEEDAIRRKQALEDKKKTITTAAEREKLDGELVAALQKQELLTKQREEAERKKDAQAAKLASVQQLLARKDDTLLQPADKSKLVDIPISPADAGQKKDAGSIPIGPVGPIVEANAVPTTGGTTPVQIEQAVPARYPLRALQMKWQLDQEHRVTVEVFVDTTGKVKNLRILESVLGDYGFDEAAEEAAKKSTYIPAKKDGKPVPAWFAKTYVFAKRK